MSEAPRRRRRALWIGLALLLLLLGAAALALPAVLEAALVRAVDDLAGRHGLDVRWAAADIRRDGLTLTDVRAVARGGRARIAEVRVEVDLWAAATGEVRISRIDVDGPELRLGTLDGERDAIDESSMTSPEPSVASRMAFDDAFEMPSSLDAILTRLDDGPLPEVRMQRPAVQLRRGDAVHRATLASLALLPEDGRWRLEGAGGELTARGQRLSGLTLDGALWADGVRIAVDIAPDQPLSIGPGTAAAERVVLAVGRHAAEIRAEGVDARAMGATAEGLVLAARWTDRLRLHFEAGAVRAPRAMRGGRADVAHEQPSALDRLDAIAWQLPPVVAHGLAVELPGLPPLLEAGGRWHRGQLDGRAVLAGGEVTLAADVHPGRRRPHSLRVDLRGVRLAPLFARRLPPEPPRRPRRQTRADGILDGHLTMTALDDVGGEGPGEAQTLLEGRLAWREGRIELPGLADGPVDGIDLDLRGALDWHPTADLLRFEGRMAQGPLALIGSGRIDDARGDPHVHLSARGEPIDCQAAFDAIPRGLWGPYDRARLTGELAPTFRLDWPVHRPATLELKIRKLFKACAVETLAARSAPPATVEDRPAPGLDDVGWLDTRFVLPVREGISEGADVRVGPGVPGYVPLAQLPRYVGATMYQSEEMNFWRNNAIDRGLLVRALRIDLDAGRFVYGGSTVTQQLVKNLFLTRKKTLARKLQELLVATRITQAISRERVLELYLNCIEFGPDLYGIGPAARYYFQKDARQLTPREAVFLAMLKPAPRRGAYYRRRGHPPIGGWWAQRAQELMRRLVENGQISAALAEAERPYHIEWVDRRYVVPDRAARPVAPAPAPTMPPTPFGGSRLTIEP